MEGAEASAKGASRNKVKDSNEIKRIRKFRFLAGSRLIWLSKFEFCNLTIPC